MPWSLFLFATVMGPAVSHGEIVISVAAESFSAQEVIRLKDIAQITGAPRALANQIAELDLVEFPATSESISIDRDHIQLRLLLGVVTNESLRVTGAPTVQVRRAGQRIADAQILTKASAALAELWNADPSAVKVRLMRPINEPALQGAQASDLEIVVPATARPGSLRATLLVHEQGTLQASVELQLDVQLSAELLVATANLPRGHTLAENDLMIRWQPVRKPGTVLTQAEAIGQVLRSPVKSGQVMESRLLTTAANKTAAHKVIKTRDIVRLVGKSDTLSVTVSDAEAMQSGGIGDRIRVRNPSSNKIVVARVVSATQVEMEL
jgi:flagella basal body P-ring formation protein FlgA